MEMQQVRYFLAVAKTLNFTRAAESCNVTQPALTRAIRQLEDELGGELIRREGRLSHLTDLGLRMLPLLTQCHESALGAKTLAARVRRGEVTTLAIAITRAFDLGLLLPAIAEVRGRFPETQLKVRRGTGAEIAEWLKAGDVDIAIGGPLGEGWDRVDSWPMFAEAFELVVGSSHPLAGQTGVGDLSGERLLVHAGGDPGDPPDDAIAAIGLERDDAHEVGCARDLEVLVAAGFGVALLPASALRDPRLHRRPCPGGQYGREVAVHAIAGRARSPAATALLSLLRMIDWPAALVVRF